MDKINNIKTTKLKWQNIFILALMIAIVIIFINYSKIKVESAIQEDRINQIEIQQRGIKSQYDELHNKLEQIEMTLKEMNSQSKQDNE